MKALVLKEKGRFAYEQRQIPACAEDEVLVRPDVVSICGSDIHAIKGNLGFFQYPRVIGHEVSAHVVERGKNARSFEIGDHVCLMPCISCGKCLPCRRGVTNACANLRLYGVHVDGGLQEYFAVPEKYLLKLPNCVTSEQASLIEPMTIGIHAARKIAPQAGDNVLILGAGPIGLCCAMAVSAMGAKPVMADISAVRRRFAGERFGFAALDPMSETYLEEIRSRTDGDLFYGVMDTTANKTSMQSTYRLICHGGRIVFIGVLNGTLEIDGARFHMLEPTLMTSRNSTRSDYEFALERLVSRELKPEGMITDRFPFDDASERLLRPTTPETAPVKQIVLM